jgi:hypothetical protein
MTLSNTVFTYIPTIKTTMNLRNSVFLLIGLFISMSASAQIPNAGFENWTNGQPDGWLGLNTKQTSDAHSGASAVMGQVGFNLPGAPATVGTTGNNVALGFPYTGRTGSFTGYYKFSPIAGSNDTISFTALFTKYNANTGNTDMIGAGEVRTSTSAGTYTQFTVPVYWFSSDSPDSAECGISTAASANGIGTTGTTFEVDDVSFGGSSGVTESITPSLSLSASVPNPVFSGSKIKYSLANDGPATLTLYDVTGRQIAVLASGYQSAGNHMAIFDGSALPAGMYYYRLTTTEQTTGQSLQLIK